MESFRSTINNSKNNRNNSKTFHISFIVKLISLYLIIVKSFFIKGNQNSTDRKATTTATATTLSWKTTIPIPSWTTIKASGLQTGTSQYGKNGDIYCSKAYSCCLGYFPFVKRDALRRVSLCIHYCRVLLLPVLEHQDDHQDPVHVQVSSPSTLTTMDWIIYGITLCSYICVQLSSIALSRAFTVTFWCSTWSDIQMRKDSYQQLVTTDESNTYQ